MRKLFSVAAVAFVIAVGSLAGLRADVTTAPAAPACCGESCKKMGACCKLDANGKMVCGMGGNCCIKADAPATNKQ